MHCSYKLHITSHQNVWGTGQDWSGLQRFFCWVWKHTNQQRHLTKPCSCLSSFPLGEASSYTPLLWKTESANTFHGSSTYHTTKELWWTHLRELRAKQQNQQLNINFLFWNSVLFQKYNLPLHKTLHKQNAVLASSLPLTHSPLKHPGHSNFNRCWTKGIFRQHRLLNGINVQKCKLKQP